MSWNSLKQFTSECLYRKKKNKIYNFTYFSILKPNGVWVNLGPLLYHYSDIMGECSIEPTFEDICHIMTEVGFVIEVKFVLQFKIRFFLYNFDCENSKKARTKVLYFVLVYRFQVRKTQF